LHGDGTPDGVVFAPQGSLFMRRDNTGATTGLYTKTTGITAANGWQPIGVTDAVAPTGVIQAYGGTTAPDSWLICDGTAHSRTVYSDLFGVVGTHYGSGDGSTTFNVPDLRGRVAVGYAASGGHVDVSTLGNNDGQASANRRPKHRTSLSTAPRHTAVSVTNGAAAIQTDNNISDTAALPGLTAGTNNANDALDTPSYLVVNHIIKT
jgi:microcystin-dependent protein